MKNKIFGLLAFLITIVSFQSCKEDIELTGDFKETAVVFALLDQADSLHMLKITRAFIGPGDALTFAQIPDSNYFASVSGTVTEYINGSPARVFNLADTTILNKDPNGVFYAPTQRLYYFATSPSNPLLDNAEYRLNLSINNGQFSVTGKTNLVNGITENISSKTQPFKFVISNGDFATTLISVGSGNSYQISTALTIEYTEWVGTTPTIKTIDWKLGEVTTNPGETKGFNAGGEQFYTLIKNSTSSDPSITKRSFNSITTTVTGAAQDFYNYILVNEPSSSLAQNKPTFTNLSVSNGFSVVGIFSARQTVKVVKPLIDPSNSNFIRCINVTTTDKLCTGPITGTLLFCSDHPADVLKTWSCP